MSSPAPSSCSADDPSKDWKAGGVILVTQRLPESSDLRPTVRKKRKRTFFLMGCPLPRKQKKHRKQPSPSPNDPMAHPTASGLTWLSGKRDKATESDAGPLTTSIREAFEESCETLLPSQLREIFHSPVLRESSVYLAGSKMHLFVGSIDPLQRKTSGDGSSADPAALGEEERWILGRPEVILQNFRAARKLWAAEISAVKQRIDRLKDLLTGNVRGKEGRRSASPPSSAASASPPPSNEKHLKKKQRKVRKQEILALEQEQRNLQTRVEMEDLFWVEGVSLLEHVRVKGSGLEIWRDPDDGPRDGESSEEESMEGKEGVETHGERRYAVDKWTLPGILWHHLATFLTTEERQELEIRLSAAQERNADHWVKQERRSAEPPLDGDRLIPRKSRKRQNISISPSDRSSQNVSDSVTPLMAGSRRKRKKKKRMGRKRISKQEESEEEAEEGG